VTTHQTGTQNRRDEAWRVVRSVLDPELPVISIEDLGILRDAEIVGDTVRVTITPTYSGCPALDAIRDGLPRR